MKRLSAITLFAAIVTVVAVSGCTGLFGDPDQPTPVPTVYGPIPSPTPTVTPTPVPDAAIAHSISSNDVKIFTSTKDYEAVDDGRTRDGKQYETIHLFAANDGTQTARNVKIVVTITNEYTENMLVYQEFTVGDLARGETKAFNYTTYTHDPCNFIKLTIDVSWGESREYYNPIQYKNPISFPI